MTSIVIRAAVAASVAAAAMAAEHRVGPGQPLAEVDHVPWESLAPGDVVSIHARPEPYRGKWVICARGTPERPILVRGVRDAAGRLPVIEGDGAVTRRALDFWGEERGIVKIGGANRPADVLPAWIVVEGLEIRGGRPPHAFTGRRGLTPYASNAAAVFIEKGQDITIRGCVLADCGNGLFVSPQTARITIEGCDIRGNGIEDSILEHNAYTQSRSIEYRFNRFGPLRAGCRGNNLKDRSADIVVRANWIEGGNRCLDLVDGDWPEADAAIPVRQRTLVAGNVLVKLDDHSNNQVVHYGGDSGAEGGYRSAPLIFLHNTVVSRRPGPTTLVRLSTQAQRAECRGNILFTTGPGRTLAIFTGAGLVELRDNWLVTGWRETHSEGSGRVAMRARGPEGKDPGFVAANDYRLVPGSPCAGAPRDRSRGGTPEVLPDLARPTPDAANVPLDGRGNFTDLGALPVKP